MLVMMNFVFSTALSALLAAPVFQEPARESAIFDLGALSGQVNHVKKGLTVMDPFRWASSQEVEFSSDDLHPGRFVDLFEQVLDGGSMHSVSGSGDSLLLSITASAANLETARQLYRFLESSLSSSRQFEVLSFDSSQVSPANNSPGFVLSPEDAGRRIEEVRSSGADVERWALTIRPSRSALVSNESTIPFLADYDVEIAQGAYIFDPVTCFPRLGQLLCARATPAGDAARLSLFFRKTEALGAPHARSVTFGGLTVSEVAQASSLDSAMPLEQLEVQSHGFGIQVALRSGEAVELSIERSAAGADRASYLIRCLDAGPGAVHRGTFGDLELVLIDPGASHQGSIRLVQENRLFPLDPSGNTPEATVRLPREEQGPVIDRLRRAGSSGGSGQLGPYVTFLMNANDSSTEGVDAYFDELESSDLAHRFVTATVAEGGEPVARFQMPCLAGSRGFAFSARGSLRIVDAEVEVAQNVSVIEPEVAQVMEGAAVVWHARNGGQVSMEASVRSGESSVLALGEIGKGILDRLPLRFLHDRRGLVDGAAELGSQGSSGLGALVQLR